MTKNTKTDKQRVGAIGESVASSFLKKKGFTILERNYWRKWGEIDIVTKKDEIIHFVEVKSVSRVTPDDKDNFRPEDNMHPWKLKRLSRVIQTYLLDKNLDCDWQLDLVVVRLNDKTRQARVEILENIVI